MTFDTYYNKTFKKWVNFLTRILGDYNEAENAVQDVFLAMLKRPDDKLAMVLADEGRDRYFMRAMLNRAYKLCRDKEDCSYATTAVEQRAFDKELPPDERVMLDEQIEMLREKVFELPQPLMRLIFVAFYEGKCGQEAFKMLGIPKATYYKQYKKALKLLREKLK